MQLQMSSRREVCSAIDAAGEVFRSCWSTIVMLKRGEIKRDRLLAFQPDLGQSLYDLSRCYDRLSHRRAALIQRKPTLEPEWFVQRMRALGAYSDALKEAIGIGKSIGDSFAWALYNREDELLQKHFEQQGQRQSPPGIGGLGEIEFIRHFPVIGDHLLIYHGTTAFLRLGDLSLLHLPSSTVTALGELKTRRIDDQRLESSLYILGSKERLSREMIFGATVPHSTSRSKPSMGQKQRRQLDRQLQTIEQALTSLITPSHIGIALEEGNIFRIGGLVTRARFQKAAWDQLDDGLIAVGLRAHRRDSKLSSRLLPRKDRDISTALAGMPKVARRIIDPHSNGNALFVNALAMGFRAGSYPLLLSPLPSEVVRALLFKEVVMLTLFNPAHIIRKLERAGFEVVRDAKGNPSQVSMAGLAARGLESTLSFIYQDMLPEVEWVRMVTEAHSTIRKQGLPAEAVGKVLFAHRYGRPPSKDTGASGSDPSTG